MTSGELELPRDLRNRTKDLALRVVRMYSALPKTAEAQVLGKQVLRSGTSVGAHYREATRARSTNEFISKVEVGIAELDETGYWVELITEAGIVPRARVEDLLDAINQLMSVLVTCVKNAKKRRSDG